MLHNTSTRHHPHYYFPNHLYIDTHHVTAGGEELLIYPGLPPNFAHMGVLAFFPLGWLGWLVGWSVG